MNLIPVIYTGEEFPGYKFLLIPQANYSDRISLIVKEYTVGSIGYTTLLLKLPEKIYTFISLAYSEYISDYNVRKVTLVRNRFNQLMIEWSTPHGDSEYLVQAHNNGIE